MKDIDEIRLLFVLLGFHGELPCGNLFFGHGYFSIKTDVVPMGKKDVQIVVPVPVFSQNGGNFVGGVVLVKRFGMGDVIVVGYSSILGSFLMIG